MLVIPETSAGLSKQVDGFAERMDGCKTENGR